MRITNGMMSRNLINNLQLNMKRMDKLNAQSTSGKRFEKPSDNPVAMAKSLKLYTDISRVEQYKRNLRDAQSWLNTTEDGLTEIGDVLQRTRELAVDAANGTKTEADAQKIAVEVKQLKDQIIKLANMRHSGRSIFTGYKTDQDLLGAEGNYTVDLNRGSDGEALDEVSIYSVGISENLDVNILGSRLFGVDENPNADSTESGQKSHMVDVFDQLITAMGASEGNPKGFSQDKISELIGDVDKVLENTLMLKAEVGAKTNRLEMTSDRLESEELNFTTMLSENEDVDQAEVIMKFNTAQAIYNASLAMGAKTIQQTLADFLR